jgi:hypothetical protein
MSERANVLQPCLGLFMHWLGHSTRDVGHLVDPAALFFRRRVDVPQCGPKTQRTVPAGQIRRNRQPLSYEYPSFCAKQEPPISILEC